LSKQYFVIINRFHELQNLCVGKIHESLGCTQFVVNTQLPHSHVGLFPEHEYSINDFEEVGGNLLEPQV
jgi:hypothetical protein